ncbi:MAG: methyltransferase domain-containing protein [Thermomicrobiales bacterium]
MTHGSVQFSVADMIRCPACGGAVGASDTVIRCLGADCRRSFPIVDGVPILIDERQSVFSLADYRPASETPAAKRGPGRFLPDTTTELNTTENFNAFGQLLTTKSAAPTVLVVGGQIIGSGMDALVANARIHFVDTDVTIGPRTGIVCDGHNLPFADGVFDGVIVQAVLEHVLDPQRCVAEIHRVLKPEGLVYAETPFMQQVHGGAFDFTRFSALGHRRLFRMFDEVASGACGGPATALAWSYEYFLSSLPTSRRGRQASTAFARLSSWWLKYLDRFLIDRPAALDAASGVFFMGTKAESAISDRLLITQYRGAQPKIQDTAAYPVLA